jgi:RNA-directed DNA polymerase
VVQTAVRHVLEPIFERDFAEHSYGFRPGRGCQDALRRVDHLLKAGYHWVVDADLKSYFDTIPQEPLLERVAEKIADGRVLDLVRAFLRQGIMEGMKTWTPTGGTPQGAVISPLLSNLYLNPLDHLMAQQGMEMVRYADDFVILCRSEAEAKEALERVKEWAEQAGLVLHPVKTRIVDATQAGGFDFLGYNFAQGQKRPREKSHKKFKDAIRAKTRRNHGHSLHRIIEDTNRTLRGWFGYFKQLDRHGARVLRIDRSGGGNGVNCRVGYGRTGRVADPHLERGGVRKPGKQHGSEERQSGHFLSATRTRVGWHVCRVG